MYKSNLLLNGYDCCKFCGLTNCKYDVCPSSEKMYNQGEQCNESCSYILALVESINNARNDILNGNFNKDYYYLAQRIHKELNELKKNIRENNHTNDCVKGNMLAGVKSATIACNNLYFYAKSRLNQDKRILRKTTFKYMKRNLNKFTPITIGRNSFLCVEEKKRLLKKKGINNAEIYMY